MTRIRRRRFIKLVAAGLTLPAATGAAPAVGRWSGAALGATAEIAVRHPDRDRAEALLEAAVAEIRRLEHIFSLFDPKSALVRLNRAGALDNAPLELIDLLEQVQIIHRATGGAFDPTIQPLWQLHARAASVGRAPTAAEIADVWKLVGLQHAAVAGRRVAYGRAGMAMTLNGIAQGYITDRIAELLRAGGLRHVLVDLGEIRAAGERQPGEPWRIGVAQSSGDPAERMLALGDGAIATSAPLGTVLDPAGRVGHIIDPRSGRPGGERWRRISVLHPRATIADGLSTAFVLMSGREMEAVLKALPGARLIAAA